MPEGTDWLQKKILMLKHILAEGLHIQLNTSSYIHSIYSHLYNIKSHRTVIQDFILFTYVFSSIYYYYYINLNTISCAVEMVFLIYT